MRPANAMAAGRAARRPARACTPRSTASGGRPSSRGCARRRGRPRQTLGPHKAPLQLERLARAAPVLRRGTSDAPWRAAVSKHRQGARIGMSDFSAIASKLGTVESSHGAFAALRAAYDAHEPTFHPESGLQLKRGVAAAEARLLCGGAAARVNLHVRRAMLDQLRRLDESHPAHRRLQCACLLDELALKAAEKQRRGAADKPNAPSPLAAPAAPRAK
ncbi:hypothetical protein M885DRAFT_551564 [Pelagophyceae sp. CCMP2097]|nr:hypothetical protein M885DRAFT_551564 [Pelagophyceae sp. CCMP2097]